MDSQIITCMITGSVTIVTTVIPHVLNSRKERRAAYYPSETKIGSAATDRRSIKGSFIGKISRSWTFTIIVFLLGGLVSFYFFSNSMKNARAEKRIKETLTKYYKDIESNNVEVLNYFLADNLDKWYAEDNVSLSHIKDEMKTYEAQFPYRTTNVKWDSFNSSVLPNGDYDLTYEVDYKIKSNASDPFVLYNLRIRAIMGNDLKIKSMFEERLNN